MIRTTDFEIKLQKSVQRELESLEKEKQRLERKKVKTIEETEEIKVIQRKLDPQNPLRKM